MNKQELLCFCQCVCACASVHQKFESVCHLLTSSSGLKLLYSSGKFLFCERLPNHMCIEVIRNMYLRMHTSSNKKFYTSKKSANSLLFAPGLNLHKHFYLLHTRLTFEATQRGAQTFQSIDSEKTKQGNMLNWWIIQHVVFEKVYCTPELSCFKHKFLNCRKVEK